jgi:chitin synthase
VQISWGTKEDSIPDSDLGVVIQNSHSQVDVEDIAEPADANALYASATYNLKHRTPVIHGDGALTNAEREQAAKEYYAGVRTNVGFITLIIYSPLNKHY